jgi:hypothetical protein
MLQVTKKNAWTNSNIFLKFLSFIALRASIARSSKVVRSAYYYFCGISAESKSCEASREILLGYGSINTAVAIQWLSSRHAKAAIDTQTAIHELLEAVFSVRSVPRSYKEGQLPLQQSFQTAVKRVRGRCEMAASL